MVYELWHKKIMFLLAKKYIEYHKDVFWGVINVDNLTPKQRQKNMKQIKAKDTVIELTLRKALWKKGYHYRKNYSKLPGNPDIVLTKYKIAIFCDGEFFHGRDWKDLKVRLERCSNS